LRGKATEKKISLIEGVMGDLNNQRKLTGNRNSQQGEVTEKKISLIEGAIILKNIREEEVAERQNCGSG
jgi:hypothetical protein